MRGRCSSSGAAASSQALNCTTILDFHQHNCPAKAPAMPSAGRAPKTPRAPSMYVPALHAQRRGARGAGMRCWRLCPPPRIRCARWPGETARHRLLCCPSSRWPCRARTCPRCALCDCARVSRVSRRGTRLGGRTQYRAPATTMLQCESAVPTDKLPFFEVRSIRHGHVLFILAAGLRACYVI